MSIRTKLRLRIVRRHHVRVIRKTERFLDPRVGDLVEWNRNFNNLEEGDQKYLGKFIGPFTIMVVIPKYGNDYFQVMDSKGKIVRTEKRADEEPQDEWHCEFFKEFEGC